MAESVRIACCTADPSELSAHALFKAAVDAVLVRDLPAFAALVDGNVREVRRNYEDLFYVVTRVTDTEEFLHKLLELDEDSGEAWLARVHVRHLRHVPYPGGKQTVRALCRHYGHRGVLQRFLEEYGTLEDGQDPSFRANTTNFLVVPMRRVVKESVSETFATDIIQLYLENGADVNARYKVDGGQSAVHYGAYNNLWQCVELMLRHGADVDYVYEGSTARQIIDNRMMHELLAKYEYPDLEPSKSNDVTVPLFNALYEKDEEKFQNIYLATITQHGKYSDDDWNLICKLAPMNYIMEFVSDGESSEQDLNLPALTFSQDDGWNTLLQLACRKNLNNAVRTILQIDCEPDRVSALKDPALLLAAEGGHLDIVLQLVSHGCDEAGHCGDVDVTVTGDHGDTLLHKLARAWHRNSRREELATSDLVTVTKIIEQLDARGELDINCENTKQETPLKLAMKSCNKSLFNLLLKKGAFIGVSKRVLRDIRYEELENMLNSTMSSEQYKGHKFVNIDFECLYLQYDIPNVPEFDIYPEMLPLYQISKSKSHKVLLSHPLITSFLDLKWLRFYSIYFMNLLVYLCFVISLTCHVCFLTVDDTTNAAVSFWFLTGLWSYILLRELMQLTMSYSEYFKTVENWLELFIIAATIILLQYGINEYTTFLVLATYSEFSLLLGRHPKVATYIAMFLRVSKVNILLLVLSSPIVFAFATCFTILLRHDEDNPYFHNSTSSMFKTLVMITGEFELGEIKFGSTPVLSKLVFLMFVVAITIILMNLLNALAVNDTEAIQRDAEIISLQAKIELFTKIESALLGYPMDWYLNQWGPFPNSNFFYYTFKLRVKFKRFLDNISVLPMSINNKFLFTIREDGKIMDKVVSENGKIIMKDNNMLNIHPRSRLLRFVVKYVFGVNTRQMFEHSYYYAVFLDKSSSDSEVSAEVKREIRLVRDALKSQQSLVAELRTSSGVQSGVVQRLSEEVGALTRVARTQSEVLEQLRTALVVQTKAAHDCTREVVALQQQIKLLVEVAKIRARADQS